MLKCRVSNSNLGKAAKRKAKTRVAVPRTASVHIMVFNGCRTGYVSAKLSPSMPFIRCMCAQVGRNVVHGSDSPENGDRELALWFEEGQLVQWQQHMAPWLLEKN